MTFEQLQDFVVSKDYDVDPFDGNTLDSLRNLVLDIEEDEAAAEDEVANEEEEMAKEMDDSSED